MWMVHENQEAKEEKRMRNKVFHKNENFMIEIPNTQQTLCKCMFFFSLENITHFCSDCQTQPWLENKCSKQFRREIRKIYIPEMMP